MTSSCGFLALCALLYVLGLANAHPAKSKDYLDRQVPTDRDRTVTRSIYQLEIPCPGLVCSVGFEPAFSFGTDSCFCQAIKDGGHQYANIVQERQAPTTTSSAASINTAVPTFVPPPKAEITPELLNESLSLQPQNTATVVSATTYFQEGVISYLVQLSGIVAELLTMNASTSFPCGSIGAGSSPDLVLVPQAIQGGTPQTTIADCMIIAVNMYRPQVIYYWVQNNDGSIFSLAGDNQVHDLNKINTTVGTALNILTTDANELSKRDSELRTTTSPLHRRQIYHIECGSQCPFYHMTVLKGSDGYCGCIFKSANEPLVLPRRGLQAPTAYSAIMTEAVCKGIICTQNGGKPALYNPFSLTCWCNTSEDVEVDPSGESAPSS